MKVHDPDLVAIKMKADGDDFAVSVYTTRLIGHDDVLELYDDYRKHVGPGMSSKIDHPDTFSWVAETRNEIVCELVTDALASHAGLFCYRVGVFG